MNSKKRGYNCFFLIVNISYHQLLISDNSAIIKQTCLYLAWFHAHSCCLTIFNAKPTLLQLFLIVSSNSVLEYPLSLGSIVLPQIPSSVTKSSCHLPKWILTAFPGPSVSTAYLGKADEAPILISVFCITAFAECLIS